ncbi:TPA_asm: LO7 [Leatherback sea turtle adomavirus]|nr:TPA_asm: LO7 [Leatherback sea turtle adomavirus]
MLEQTLEALCHLSTGTIPRIPSGTCSLREETECKFVSIGMTTTGSENHDSDLSGILQENLSEQHVYAPITDILTTREAQVGGGPDLTTILNIDGPREASVLLQCQRDEAILMGSIRFYARGKLQYTGSSNGWKITGKSGPSSATEIRVISGTSSTPDHVTLPPLLLNSQFQTVDIRVGTSGSVNAHLQNLRGSAGGNGALAVCNRYFNTPQLTGVTLDNSFDDLSQLGNRSGLQIKDSDDPWEGVETLYHQLNTPCNSLCSTDFDDQETLKILPRGLQLGLKFVTRQFLERVILQPTYSSSAGSIEAGKFLKVVFEEVKVLYTCCRIPQEYIPLEPQAPRFVTMDLGIEAYPLSAAQQSVTVHVTKNDTDFVPHYVILFVGQTSCFHLRNLFMHGFDAVNAIKSFFCTFNGSNTPDFMRIYVDARCALDSLVQRRTMHDCYLGKGALTPGRWREFERPPAERHLQLHVESLPASRCVFIPTDPSTYLVREASGGISVGRLDVTVELTTTAVKAGMSVYVVKFGKQHIQLVRTAEFPGTLPQYEILAEGTSPAFTHTVGVDLSRQTGDDFLI